MESLIVADLSKLPSLTEDSVLVNLKRRFNNGLYYTFLGDVVVAVNPYDNFSSKKTGDHAKYVTYKHQAERSEPHIFWTAQQTYCELLATSKGQCVLISGESGTGKTESTKLFIEHISYMCNKSDEPNDMHEKITRVNPLLESFGNAVTPMNTNSSRFGKLVELQMTKDGTMRSAMIHDYLLEKTRVVSQGQGERNFHIFYYMFAGLNAEQRVYYDLGNVSDYRILRHGRTPAFSHNQISHLKSRFDHLITLMTYIGFSDDDVKAILSVLAAILHLTNIEFTVNENLYDDGVAVCGGKSLDPASSLLGIPTDILSDALASNTIDVRGEAVKSHKKVHQAEDGRDSLAKSLYSRLFGWIVAQINLHLQANDNKRENVSSISILDFSGFECVQKNGFDQLCINTANERLHQIFHHHIFAKERDDLIEQGIQTDLVNCKDNQDLIDLFFQKPRGLFYLIDEESAFPQSSDRTLVSKLDAVCSHNPHYLPSRGNSYAFSIVHYAGEVLYDANGMLKRNSDSLGSSLHQRMLQSNNGMIRLLFSSQGDLTGSFSRSFTSPKTRNMLQGSRMTTNKDQATRSTVSVYFRKSLNDLTAKLQDCKPWFIRCMRPNNKAVPNVFQDEVFLTQLRYNGLLEIARIRRHGFPDRMTFPEFIHRYRDICFDRWTRLSENRQEAESIFTKCGLRDFAFGTSKIFLRAGHKEKLDQSLELRQNEIRSAEEEEMRLDRKKQEEMKRKARTTDHNHAGNNPRLLQKLRQRNGNLNESADEIRSEKGSLHRKVQDWIDVNDSPDKQAKPLWDEENRGHEIEGSIGSDETDDQLLDRNLWDRFLIVPRDNNDEHSNFLKAMKVFKVVCYLLIFVIVLGSGVATKLSILTLTTGRSKNTNNEDSEPKMTMLLIAICFPYVTNLLAYGSKSLFGSTGWPSLKMTLAILALEFGHTAGLCLLVFRVLPRVDMMRALILMTSVCTGPTLMKFVFTIKNRHESSCKKFIGIMIGLLCIGFQALSVTTSSYIRFTMTAMEQHTVKRTGNMKNAWITSVVKRSGSEEFSFEWDIPVALALISLVYWENFVETDIKICGLTIPFNSWKKILHLMKQRLYIAVSLWKITWSVIFAVVMIEGFNFSLTFQHPQINGNVGESESHLLRYGPLYCIIVASVLCSYFSGLACKLNMQGVSFALPLTLVTPASFVVVYLRCRHSFLPVNNSPYLWVCAEDWSDILPYHWALLGCVWLSHTLLCTHVWQPNSERLAKIDKLFVTPIRCSVLTGESLMLRRRTPRSEKILEKGLEEYSLYEHPEDIVPQIYACATMWHETRQEMTKLLKSIFRMDIDHSARTIAQKYYKIKDPDYYEFEAHVFFDDAFDVIRDEVVKPNAFVARFVECLDEAISSVHERPTTMNPPVKTSTPYGGRLTWTLPGGTILVAHLKDKSRIRNKKRWSQVMYLYYLLGYNLLAHYDTSPDDEEDDPNGETARDPNKMRLTSAELRNRRKSAFFSRSVIFDYVTQDVQNKADNTYLLTLDGDVDFKPEAVHLLIDRMKKNKKVGAACGRIHPVGSGPIIWYQQFEYAIGHWLQKAMEHVFGCVMCAPGCFSLFRGSALMDDNVARLYATRSTEAGHYIQFDQGEDRWLSTLLLQQGYRIDYCAAADALTQAPETFNEFFNQRRRWGPSTLANLFDLLGSWKSTVKMNDNISTLYMFYQALMMSSSLLGPATVLLMMSGAYQVVFKVTVIQSYVMSIAPAVFYVLICMYTKIDIQHTIGAIMSAIYAIVMTVVLVGTVGTAISGSVTSPNVIFMVLLGVVFIIAGLLHPREIGCLVPGVLYFICIPAGYLVLSIYFLSNIHVVSWGTREIAMPKTKEELEKAKKAEEKKQKKKSKNKKGLLGWLGIRYAISEFFVMMRQLFEINKKSTDKKQNSTRRSIPHGKEPTESTNELLLQLIEEMRLNRGGNLAGAAYNTHYAHPTSNDDQRHPVGKRQGEEKYRRDEDDDGDDFESSENDDVEGNLDTVIVDAPHPFSESTSQLSSEDPERPSWIHHQSMGNGSVKKLGERERVFWSQLLARYLYPIVDEPHNKERIRKDLLFLRNNVVFAFFMTSAVWIALFMQLEILQDELKSHLFVQIPSLNGDGNLSFQPLGLIFLSCFTIILMIQFLGMFAHRWGTMLHTLSITDVGLGTRVKEQNKVRDIIMKVSNLQKLKHIDLEPEADYDEPLPEDPVPDFDGSDDIGVVQDGIRLGNAQYGNRHNPDNPSGSGFYLQQKTSSVLVSEHEGPEMYPGWSKNASAGFDQRGFPMGAYEGAHRMYQPSNLDTSGVVYQGGSMDAPPSYKTQVVPARGRRSMVPAVGSVRRNQWGVLDANQYPMAHALENAFEKRFRNKMRQQQQVVGNQSSYDNLYSGPRVQQY